MKSSVIICIILCIVSSTVAEKLVVCYWDSASNRHENLKGYFTVDNIDPTICTHIIYTYIRFLQSVVIVPNYNEDTIKTFIKLKQQNPNVKLLIGVGGPEQKAQIPSIIASTATDRSTSGQRLKEFIEKFGFDGVDFDWQYPGQGTGTSSADKENFVKIISTWRNILTSSKILSISVATRQKDIDESYDIAGIIQHVDFINLNSYNLRGSSNDTVTAFHSPYRKKINDIGEQAEYSAESIVNNWIANGCPASKLTLGIATFGRSFTLSDASQTSVGSPVSGIGRKSSYLSNNPGVIPYAEICYNIRNNDDWVDKFDNDYFAPYAVFDSDQWVSFDSKSTVLAKTHLAVNKKLAGVNFANIDRDDFANGCGDGKFPLIKIGYEGIVNEILPENPIDLQPQVNTTTSRTTTTTRIPSTVTTTTFRPGITTTSLTTTTARITTTTTSTLPDENTAPIFTGSTTTVSSTNSPIGDDSTTTRTTTTKKITTIFTDFPTPPTLDGLNENSSTTGQTTASEILTELQSTTTKMTTTKTTRTTTTPFPTPPVTPSNVALVNANSMSVENFVCPESNGNFANLYDCSMIFICSDGVAYAFYCSTGMYYDAISERCEEGSRIEC